MKLKKFLIAGGNSTLLVWNCSDKNKREIVGKFLGDVEQIGFISTNKGLPKLTMMGNELCINATIALASELGKSGSLKTSGLNNGVYFQNDKGFTTITFPIEYKIIKNTILLPGIGFIFSKSARLSLLSKLAQRYNLPAFGSLTLNRNILKPTIYVKETNSLVEETACGSGSIATYLFKGIQTITQPTGEKIFVERKGKVISVSAKVFCC